ncbi:hypothetical protein GCM10008090_12190 [Arenicella chitinivorans]|uniref:ATP-grasp domain-containing protein n=1 Tax=Arenicella chitinivorans TaxID=1329800 RepID=A0A918RM33_9GAMM|nr:ATP-grasp domain-containing protein [Arenicella chitinivorans]GHA04392.1 hypothetical protein GCM10008090_12190 [Arenicella chitinivorans]
MKTRATNSPFAVVVFPEEAGLLLTGAFNAQGIRCIEIASRTGDPADQSHFQAALSQLGVELANQHLLCVVPGSERGVPLADRLAAHYAVFANRTEHQAARYRKSVLAKTAREAGLTVPWQRAISEQQDLLTLKPDLNWPLVLKPDASMGSEGVTCCDSFAELQQTFDTLHRQTNRLGRNNQTCVIQTYLDGTEYAIDSMSFDGQHKIVALWQYVKSTAHILGSAPFTSKRLLPASGELQSVLASYTGRLLDASGVRYGPAHTELVVEKTHPMKPTLMEMGARLHGGQAAMRLSNWCIGHSQVDACVAAYTQPAQFLTTLATPYKLRQHGEIVLLICPHSQLRVSRVNAAMLSDLASVRHLDIDYTPSRKPHQIIGMLILAHRDANQIKNDLAQIRALEDNGLYLPVASVA